MSQDTENPTAEEKEPTPEELEKEAQKLVQDQKKLAEQQKTNVKKANKIIANAAKALEEIGFTLNVVTPQPQISLRPLNIMEWKQVEQRKFRESFLPENAKK